MTLFQFTMIILIILFNLTIRVSSFPSSIFTKRGISEPVQSSSRQLIRTTYGAPMKQLIRLKKAVEKEENRPNSSKKRMKKWKNRIEELEKYVEKRKQIKQSNPQLSDKGVYFRLYRQNLNGKKEKSKRIRSIKKKRQSQSEIPHQYDSKADDIMFSHWKQWKHPKKGQTIIEKEAH